MINQIIKRLEDKQNYCDKRADLDEYYDGKASAFDEAIEVVQEVAKEYGNGVHCIGCSDCQHKECEHHGKV